MPFYRLLCLAGLRCCFCRRKENPVKSILRSQFSQVARVEDTLAVSNAIDPSLAFDKDNLEEQDSLYGSLAITPGISVRPLFPRLAQLADKNTEG